MADNFKTVLKDIWDDKALLVTVLIGGGALVYLAFFRNNNSSGTALEAPNSTPTDMTGGYNPFDYAALATPTSTIINVPAPVVNNIPIPTPVSSPLPSPFPGTRQLPTVTSGWLASTPGGTNNKGKNLANLAKGTVVMLLSNTAASFGGNRYYQVQAGNQKGYVNAKTLGL